VAGSIEWPARWCFTLLLALYSSIDHITSSHLIRSSFPPGYEPGVSSSAEHTFCTGERMVYTCLSYIQHTRTHRIYISVTRRTKHYIGSASRIEARRAFTTRGVRLHNPWNLVTTRCLVASWTHRLHLVTAQADSNNE
jgi:hypothetical protein